MRRGRVVAGLSLLLGAVVVAGGGCARRPSPPAVQSVAPPAGLGTPAPAAGAADAGGAVHQGGFHLAVVTEKSEYKPGETVVIQATLSNLSQESKDYTIWGIGDPQIYVTAAGPSGEEISLPVDRRRSLPAKVFVTLQPGEGFTYTVKWDQTRDGATRVKPGKYALRAYVYPGRLQDRAGVAPVEARREVSLLP